MDKLNNNTKLEIPRDDQINILKDLLLTSNKPKLYNENKIKQNKMKLL